MPVIKKILMDQSPISRILYAHIREAPIKNDLNKSLVTSDNIHYVGTKVIVSISLVSKNERYA